MANCVVCGKEYQQFRKDHLCCSSNCRHKLSRQRKQRGLETNRRSWRLEDAQRLEKVRLVDHSVYQDLHTVMAVFGRDYALMVLGMIERTLEAAYNANNV